jgi:gliding motility-associated-like protein
MNFSYFKEKILTLKRYYLLAIFLFPALISVAQQYGNIEFIENKGQWDNRVLYKAEVSGGAIFLRNGGFTILQHNPQDLLEVEEMVHHHGGKTAGDLNTPITLRSHAWNVDFVGARQDMQIIPDKIIPTRNNYFIGNDPSKWGGDCRIFQAVTLKDVYPNIDVRYYTYNGTLKYDILVKPGGDPNKIALKYNGTDKLQVKNKELVISTTVGERKESSPYTYQTDVTGRREISCKYVIRDNTVRFDVKNYDPNSLLVIDPSLVFCSFSGSTANNWGYTATYGPDGSFYGGGIVFGNGFPTQTGAFQTTFQGGTGTEAIDIGVIKLSPDGSTRVYATYIGGSGNEQPHSLIVDPQGNLVVAGRSNSPNYPVTGGAAGQIGPGGGNDIVVTKLNAGGTALIGSKKMGGSGEDGVNIAAGRNGINSLQRNYGDDGRSEVILDGSGNVYVASSSQSSNFPVTAGGFGATLRGNQDAVLVKFNSTISASIFSGYLGGTLNDAAYVLAIGPSGNIYVAGGTESDDFLQGTQAGTKYPTFRGQIDGFIAIVAANGSTVLRSTYMGTSGIDQVYGIQFDRLGFPYITGQTTGSWEITPGTPTYGSSNGKQFIVKLQPDLSAFVYSTVFGTNAVLPNISPTAFLVDRCENVYVSGWGGVLNSQSPSFYANSGTTGLPITADALDPSTDGSDFYFFVLQRDAVSQLYGTFFGQTGGFADHVDGGTSRFDQNGVIYQGVCANCGGTGTFPTTTGAWSTIKPSGAFCNLGMIKVAMNLAGVGSDVESAIDGVPRDTAGCVPLTVDFTDQVRNAESYIWDFGDGSPQVGPLPAATGYTQSHTFNSVGTYQVMLIAIDPATCNVRDTSYINIRVGDLRAILDFNAQKIGPCTSFQYQFNNTSLAPPSRPFTDTSFVWDFGDGSPTVVSGLTPAVTHTFPAPGTYNVILTLKDTAYCNNPDSDTLQLNVAANVDARFETPSTGCVPYTAVFDNTSVAGQTWLWDFGDGNTSTAFEPTHTYNTPGTYTVTLTATDPNTCNVTDTETKTITVYSIPVADFTYTPFPNPVENTPHFFTNNSSPDAVLFKWDFGDGDTLRTTSRAVVEHQYNATGTFNACLIAFNVAGCSDTLCRQVETLITPVVDVPNAFTPQSGDINSKVMVRGFGIAKMRFIIWNRWGQKVFETGNRFDGWDGKVKGQLQPMDVYAYTLDVEFFDGTKTTKKGDITLIR